jgi:hypothetical protein
VTLHDIRILGYLFHALPPVRVQVNTQIPISPFPNIQDTLSLDPPTVILFRIPGVLPIQLIVTACPVLSMRLYISESDPFPHTFPLIHSAYQNISNTSIITVHHPPIPQLSDTYRTHKPFPSPARRSWLLMFCRFLLCCCRIPRVSADELCS